MKIIPPIDLKFIVNNCTAAEEQEPQAGEVPIYQSPTRIICTIKGRQVNRIVAADVVGIKGYLGTYTNARECQ